LEKWSAFATVAGGAAAGLTGLLFVAVSIRIDVIAKSQELRNRAAQSLALFVTVLFIAVLLSIPDQSFRVLGVEFVALAVITGGSMLILDRRARVGPSTRDTSARCCVDPRRGSAQRRHLDPAPDRRPPPGLRTPCRP
jgi:hypothetical protein